MTPENSDRPPRLDFIREAFSRLQSVAEVGHLLIESEPSRLSYAESLRLACREIGAGTGMLFLLDPEQDELLLAASVGIDPTSLENGAALAVGEGLSGWVAQHREAFFSNDLAAAGRFRPVSQMKYKRASAVSVPILRHGELLGVLTFADERPGAFGRADLLMVEAVAASLALGLRCSQLRAEAEAGYLACIRGLANALEAKDPGTRGHSLRIAHFCREVGRAFDFPRERRERLEAAAYLHDIGKIGIPESVLHKPGPLTGAEWELVRRHPEMGAEILRGLPSMSEVSRFVEAHHERPDGRGYPRGLRGDEIPLESRIISAADAFDAMVTARPYRAHLPAEVALAEMQAAAGSQFDPFVVERLSEIVLHKTADHFYSESLLS